MQIVREKTIVTMLMKEIVVHSDATKDERLYKRQLTFAFPLVSAYSNLVSYSS